MAYDPRLPDLDDVDYLVVTHADFTAAAERLAGLSRTRGPAARPWSTWRARYDALAGGAFEAAAVRGLLGPPARAQEPARRRALRRRHARPARLPRPRLRRVRADADRVGRPVRPRRVREPLRRPGRRRRCPISRSDGCRPTPRRPPRSSSTRSSGQPGARPGQHPGGRGGRPGTVGRVVRGAGRARGAGAADRPREVRAGLVRHRRRAGGAAGRLARGPGGRAVLRARRGRHLGRRAPADGPTTRPRWTGSVLRRSCSPGPARRSGTSTTWVRR